MHKEIQETNHDIDLIGLIDTLWAQRWFIAIITFLSMTATITFHIVTVPQEFTAKTLISPISSADFEQYRAINELGVFEITPAQLQSLYLEQLQDRHLVRDVILEQGLVEKQNDDSDQEFEQAINKLILGIKLSIINQTPNNIDSLPDWTVEARYDDQSKWTAFLAALDEKVTESVKKQLQNSFAANHQILTTKRRFDLEDIDRRLSNALSDYQIETAQTLAFLREQASIARVLNLASVSLADRVASTLATDVTQRFPSNFYLRGYLAIEQEIELLESRQNADAYIHGYNEFLATRRTILQDQTLDRARELFAQTPISSNKNDQVFRATRLYVSSTEFTYQTGNLLRLLAVSTILGFAIGVTFVLISSALKRRRAEHQNPHHV